MTEFDEVRATVQALQGTATLLQGAMDRLGAIEQERRQAELTLKSVTTQVDLVRAEQSGVLAEFDRLVQGALSRRAALLAEINDLERRRDGLAVTVPPAAPPPPPPPAESADPSGRESSVQAAVPPAESAEPLRAENPAPVVPLPAASADFAVRESSVQADAPSAQSAEPLRVENLAPVVPPPATSADFARRESSVQADAPSAQSAEPLRVENRAPVVPLPAKAAAKRSLGGWRAITTLLLAALLLGMAVLLTPLTQAVGGLQLLAVMSGSMEPTIHVGGIVGVMPAPADSLQVGDVITFANQSNPDVLVTHRIVGIDTQAGQELLTTRGDANDAVDAVSVPAGRAVGRVLFTLPWLGYAMVWLASPVAKIAILAVCVLGLLLPSIRRARPEPEPISTYAALEREIAGLLPQ